MTAQQNMALWDSLKTTDPKFTKSIGFGQRKVTAIDAHWQIQRVTEEIGPAGQNWGAECMDVKFLPTDMVAMKVRVHLRDSSLPVEQWGQASLYSDAAKSRPDPDCMKKAFTDGLTKSLSYFGLSADVFLGQFDDNKYVESLKAEFAKAAPPRVTADEPPLDATDATTATREWGDWVKDQIAGFSDYKSIDDLQFWIQTQGATLNELRQADPGLHTQMKAAFQNRKQEIATHV
jgi:hypothetical protein